MCVCVVQLELRIRCLPPARAQLSESLPSIVEGYLIGVVWQQVQAEWGV